MRVLVACEFSGVVRDAFAKKGHYAVSCDYLPSERPDGMHHQGNVMDIIDDRWDLMVAHPPCTYLANSGVRWLYGGRGQVRDPVRWANMEDGANFFRAMLEAPIPRIAVENPVMHGHAKAIVGRDQDQTIQPWQFGHGETKATCLWLKDLPPLAPTQIIDGRAPRVHFASPSPDRWKDRSRTLEGIAAAMADQWSNL